ncbi:hypothetical protein GCM10009799_42810 [Nocardiopsis rhodophaea]|uniref:Uncharacterized protein n=1 Tax=Nocardiopsis rhodophaea TaxID=280238 RepID=A0ABN2TI89_9ACTN
MIATGDDDSAGSGWARLLLLTLIVLGVGAMHTLGHVQLERSSSAPQAPFLSAAASGPLSPATPASGDTAGRADSSRRAEVSTVTAGPQVTTVNGVDHDTSPRLDPTGVCVGVEVLVLTLAWVAIGAFTRWPGLHPPARPWPSRTIAQVDPPAAPPSLAALQVLRI